jgi:hypothetical protein
MNRSDDIKATVKLAKEQILADIDEGTVPAGVSSFRELHGHVDANEYGDLTTRDDVGDWEEFIEFSNDVQIEVDKWLAAGRPIEGA